ncbi:hypothetical protein METHPM2_1330016 [Pseudomonas sp. PM2]
MPRIESGTQTDAVGWQRQRRFVAHLLQGKAGANVRHPRYLGQKIHHETLQRLNRGHQHANQIVWISSHQVTLHHLRPVRNRPFKLLQRQLVLFLQAHMDEHIHVQPQQISIQQRDLLTNQPQFFHRLDPVETRRGRQVDRAGQVGIGDPRILLQGVENADIGTVQFAHETKSPVYYVYAVFLSANGRRRNETQINILLRHAYDCCRTRFLLPED